jgi:hypothetical protein
MYKSRLCLDRRDASTIGYGREIVMKPGSMARRQSAWQIQIASMDVWPKRSRLPESRFPATPFAGA